MKTTDVLIIGAGAAGLMAARTLAKAGKTVTVLEARNRTGGRIHTLGNESFFKHAELGAEFVHGDLPVTLDLLREAGITALSANAEMWRYEDGRLSANEEFVKGWDVLMEKLNNLTEDMPIADFLGQYFVGEEHAETRESVAKFVSGYDTADVGKASTFALRLEWQNEDEGAQHRPAGGYCGMINFLAGQVRENNGEIFLNAAVTRVEWQAGKVTAHTDDGKAYSASQLIITAPVGVLQLPAPSKGAIKFSPEIKEHQHAIQQLGFGAVIKVLLQFKAAFWLDERTRQMADGGIDNMGYLFSDEKIPTWWTQVPQKSTVLTGWLGGPDAAELKDTSDEQVLQISLESVGNIFKRNLAELKDMLVAAKVVNWTADPFARGSYGYDTVESPKAKDLLKQGVEDTIFFAGEAFYSGPSMGTVEAALASGMEVAAKLIF